MEHQWLRNQAAQARHVLKRVALKVHPKLALVAKVVKRWKVEDQLLRLKTESITQLQNLKPLESAKQL